MNKIYNCLFLCTGNSCRSIIAESIMNKLGKGQFRAFSAGSLPVGYVHPIALELLKEKGHSIQDLSSKSWELFENGPEMDFIITVCDSAAGEVCPIWPGKPITAHWGVIDPAGIEGDYEVILTAFKDTYTKFEKMISELINKITNEEDFHISEENIERIRNSVEEKT